VSDTRRGERDLLRVLICLTAVTGLIDAVSFLGLGRIFTANMTGNIVLLGFAFAGVPDLSVLRSGAAVIAFAAGSVAGARLTRPGRAPERQLLLAMASECVLLTVAAAATAGTAGPLESAAAYVVIACTAIAMGLRSAAVRRIAVPDVTTTVLTLTLAGLAADSFLAGGHGNRTGRRSLSMIAMITGAFVGAVLVQRFSITIPLVLAAGVVAALAIYLDTRARGTVRARSRP
jgi:uncharacterized membrane protein YoaK (UPF0700 family)